MHRACSLLVLSCMSLLSASFFTPVQAADAAKTEVAVKAQAALRTYCYRCHGQDGSLEGGMNYILDREKLVARHKLVPGKAEESPIFKRIAAGKMPPPGEKARPGEADIRLLRQWIDDGAINPVVSAQRKSISDTEVFEYILADQESLEGRTKRFTRYFTITNLYNAGLSEDELQTYRNALSKLINSLSWSPRITVPRAIDPARTILRIDLRDFQWDANLWNRLLADYPYGVLQDTAVARIVMVSCATRMPFVRADWFVATASRPPLYQDLLQMPTNLAELERQLRVDAAVDIQQERVARLGFNGSGVAKNNRILERHEAIHGAYWRTYDFEAVPQNLGERDNLLPDRRNAFAHPLGPGFTEASFQHIGGEAIWNLPNGLHAYMLVNAIGQRIDKANTAIVSDPKRPDRAVETGISCFTCHYAGINYKTDQIREFVQKNTKAFSRNDVELVLSLYPPAEKMKALMDEDAEKYRQAVEKTGTKVSAYEPISTLTLRFEGDLDLPTAAAEAGLNPETFLVRLGKSELLSRNLGALQAVGGTVQREVWQQGFGDVVRAMELGVLLRTTLSGQSLPDNTGEIDPLEAQSSPANAVAFSSDGKLALIAGADRSIRIWNVDAARDLRRLIGHTASVWSVAFSPDGRRALSGGADGTVRLWDVETGKEIRRFDGHRGLVSCVAFSPDGNRALSGGYDRTCILWDLNSGKELRTLQGEMKYIHAVAFAADGQSALVAADRSAWLWDLETAKIIGRLEGNGGSVVAVAFHDNDKQALTAGDDGTIRLWEIDARREVRSFPGHTGAVKCIAVSPDGRRLVSGGSDHTLRLWDMEKGQELKAFRKHGEAVVGVIFSGSGSATVSASRDAAVLTWSFEKKPLQETPAFPPPGHTPDAVKAGLQAKAVIPIESPINSLQLSPNGKWLYALDSTHSLLLRINTAKQKQDQELKLADGAETIALSRDGKTLYSLVRATKGDTTDNRKPRAEGKLQLIDPLKMQVGKTIAVAIDPFDIAVLENGLVLLSGGSGDWTDIAIVDPAKEHIVSRWGGIWRKSFLQVAPDQKCVYVSTQGVSPGTVTALLVPEKLDDKPVSYPSSVAGKLRLGGEIVITPDGNFLLCRTGAVLRASAERAEDLQPVATTEPFIAAAIDSAAGSLYLLTEEGSLGHYSYPGFKERGTIRLGIVGYQAAFDPGSGRLYVAGFDPKTLGGRSKTRNLGDIHVFSLKDEPK